MAQKSKTVRPQRLRPLAAMLPALALAGCISLGPKPPTELLRLTSAQIAPAGTGEAVMPGRAVTVMFPTAPAELATTRVPVRSGDTRLTYIKDATWADTPARLFRDLLAETIRARTDRPVLDARDSHLAPGLKLTGRVQQFGVDAGSRQAVMVYDATLERSRTQGPGQVETKRFTASAPVSGITSGGVAPALNTAANQVAQQVADWVGR